MELIERYVYVVTHRLPEDQREDVANELRATIEDMAADQAKGKQVDDTHIATALEQLGDPEQLADKYTRPRGYLIGPAWYDTYVKTLRRTLYIALPAAAIITFIFGISSRPAEVGGAIGDAVGTSISVALQVLFWVTAVFVMLERSSIAPDEVHGLKPRAWTVDQLAKAPAPRQISVSETLTEIVTDLTGAALIAVPFINAKIQGDTNFVPLLNPALWQGWLPVLFVILALTLIHEVFKLRIGNWTRALTITNVLLGLVSIAYLVALVTTQEVINPAHLVSVAGSMLPVEAREAARWTVGITVGCIIIAYIYSMISSIVLARRLEKAH